MDKHVYKLCVTGLAIVGTIGVGLVTEYRKNNRRKEREQRKFNEQMIKQFNQKKL
jgi:hypothetical protein